MRIKRRARISVSFRTVLTRNLSRIIRERSIRPGDFVDGNGDVLGKHRGIIRYTIGQRKGLGLALKAPGYVCGIDPLRNTVIIGDNVTCLRRSSG